VAIGNQWFGWLCKQGELDPLAQQLSLSERYGAPRPRGPFNLSARSAAGFTPQELAQLAG
jgi:uncharacterized ferritin-like protein (DUF455 family)